MLDKKTGIATLTSANDSSSAWSMIGGAKKSDDARWFKEQLGICYPKYPDRIKWFKKNAEIFRKVDKRTSKLLAKQHDCQLKECYHNAWKADVTGRYRYFEGYVISDNIPLAMAHSWLVDKNKGTVIDPTLILDVNYDDGKPIRNRLGDKYVGVEIPREWLNKTCFKLERTGDFMDMYSGEEVQDEKEE